MAAVSIYIDEGLTQAQIKAGYAIFKLASEGRGDAVQVMRIAETNHEWMRIRSTRATGNTDVRVIADGNGNLVAIMRKDSSTYSRVRKIWRAR